MKNPIKKIYRGYLSKIKPLRDIYFQLYKKHLMNKFLVVKVRFCDCYYLIDTSDEYGIWLLTRGKSETPEDDFVKNIVKSGDKIIDVGAHWGVFSVLFGKLVGEYGKVYAFEASRKNFKILKKNICINKLSQTVKPYNLAIGNEEKKVNLAIADTSSGHNSIYDKHLKGIKKYETISQTTIDKFTEENSIKSIDLLKIDVEGYEYNVLKGAEETIKRSKDMWLFVEFSPNFISKELAINMLEFLKKYFRKVYIADKKRKIVKKSSWEDIIKLIERKEQKNLFLKR